MAKSNGNNGLVIGGIALAAFLWWRKHGKQQTNAASATTETTATTVRVIDQPAPLTIAPGEPAPVSQKPVRNDVLPTVDDVFTEVMNPPALGVEEQREAMIQVAQNSGETVAEEALKEMHPVDVAVTYDYLTNYKSVGIDVEQVPDVELQSRLMKINETYSNILSPAMSEVAGTKK